jgi:hypothetical protein
MLYIIFYTTLILKILLFYKNNLKKTKKPFSKGQRAGMVKLPRQDDFRNFCMKEETEKIYHNLEEVINA